MPSNTDPGTGAGKSGHKRARGQRRGENTVLHPAYARELDIREQRLFRSLDDDNDQRVELRDFYRVMSEAGLKPDDMRLADSISALAPPKEPRPDPVEQIESRSIPEDEFSAAIRHNILLIEKALQGRLVVPDFQGFADDVDNIYEAVRENRDGAAANYIPQLDLPEPEVDAFGLAFCSIDGQRHAIGDSDAFFTVQSTCKPVSYCMALEEHGAAIVHRHVGHEPSGASFNELALNTDNRPHNPMINAGAIMTSSLVHLTEKRKLLDGGRGGDFDHRGWAGRRFEHVMNRWQALCGGEKPRFSTSVYLSERETADRNSALAYFMREMRAFPDGIDLQDVLEFYVQCCAIEVNTEMMSVIAATLANGGICPLSNERIFSTETVRNCLSLMSSCGMYDFSGEFAFTIGLPAKSGVSGAIVIVIPNVMGICVWSPRLDAHGNSVRGIEFCKRLVDRFNFHNYDNLTGASDKKDPRLNAIQMQARTINEMIWAASKGDLGALQDQLQRGTSLGCADYDLRTPLHLAAAENQREVVEFFITRADENGAEIDINPKDRWGGTPLDDAYLHDNPEIASLLESAGAKRGQPDRNHQDSGGAFGVPQLFESHKTAELVWAASVGDLSAMRRLVAQGVPLDCADYDSRAAIHLAAAEGHLEIVEYLAVHGVDPNARDRWGHTPLDEAVRHGHAEVSEFLRSRTGTDATTVRSGRRHAA